MEALVMNCVGLFFTFIAGLCFVKTTLLPTTEIRKLVFPLVGGNDSQIENLTQQRNCNIIGLLFLFFGEICQILSLFMTH